MGDGSKLAGVLAEIALNRIDSDTLVIPTMPQLATRSGSLAQDADLDAESVSKIIERDAVLAARLLRRARTTDASVRVVRPPCRKLTPSHAWTKSRTRTPDAAALASTKVTSFSALRWMPMRPDGCTGTVSVSVIGLAGCSPECWSLRTRYSAFIRSLAPLSSSPIRSAWMVSS